MKPSKWSIAQKGTFCLAKFEDWANQIHCVYADEIGASTKSSSFVLGRFYAARAGFWKIRVVDYANSSFCIGRPHISGSWRFLHNNHNLENLLLAEAPWALLKVGFQTIASAPQEVSRRAPKAWKLKLLHRTSLKNRVINKNRCSINKNQVINKKNQVIN